MSEGFQTTDRGFVHGDEIQSDYGGYVKAYESSAAMSPHIWLRVVCSKNLNDPFDREGDNEDATAHLTLENAEHLRDQLTWLIENHYQVMDR